MALPQPRRAVSPQQQRLHRVVTRRGAAARRAVAPPPLRDKPPRRPGRWREIRCDKRQCCCQSPFPWGTSVSTVGSVPPLLPRARQTLGLATFRAMGDPQSPGSISRQSCGAAAALPAARRAVAPPPPGELPDSDLQDMKLKNVTVYTSVSLCPAGDGRAARASCRSAAAAWRAAALPTRSEPQRRHRAAISGARLPGSQCR
jgi:hypothetical protein